MPISLTEDIKTLAEFENSPREFLKQIRETGRPIVITVQGKPDVVILDAATFEQRLKTANLSRLLLEAEADVRAGRTRPARALLRDLRRGKKVSR